MGLAARHAWVLTLEVHFNLAGNSISHAMEYATHRLMARLSVLVGTAMLALRG
jgi:hypothetical protein